MNHLREVIKGMGAAIDPLGQRDSYVRPTRNGFARDAEKLNGDWRRVGSDLQRKAREALSQYDEPAHYSKG